MSSWVCRRFTQNTAWLPHQCLTFLQPIHNLEPDDVTFMETEHRAFICNKVTLCNHVVWVLEGEKGKNTEKRSYFWFFFLFFLNSSNTCVCFICVIVVYLCVSGRWYNLLKLNVSGELCVCVLCTFLISLMNMSMRCLTCGALVENSMSFSLVRLNSSMFSDGMVTNRMSA